MTTASERWFEGADPLEIARDLLDFSESCSKLSSDQPRLIAEYPNRWIAVYDGEVRANSKHLGALLKKMDALGIPQGSAIVRFIDTNPETLIL